jgi:hypothetical protein
VDLSSAYAGEPVARDPGQGERPLQLATLGVVSGKATLTVGGREPVALSAPPGPAAMTWDSKGGGLSKTPLEVPVAKAAVWSKTAPQVPDRDKASAMREALGKLSRHLSGKGKAIDLALAEFEQEKDRSSKVLTVFCQAAVGAPAPLIDALEDPMRPELRIASLFALDGWLGRSPDRDGQLFRVLLDRKGYTETQADLALKLLHGFSDLEQNNPATYEVLLACLRNDRLAVRELALWRLTVLDPEGAARSQFNAAGSPEERERAFLRWKARIPDGQLPPGRKKAAA